MGGKRRLIEWGKDLLILLLSLSALWLLGQTALVRDSGLLSLFSAPEEESASTGVTLSAASRPARIAVWYDGGRYAVQYDQDGVDELFTTLSPLLGEALTSAGTPRLIGESRWQSYLAVPSVYFDFSGSVSLSALAGWLGEGECALSGSARRLLLAAGEGDAVLLCYQDEDSGLFYACDTALSQTLHLLPAVEGRESNGAGFAFEDDGLRALLAPYTLVTETEPEGVIYTASTPLTASSDVSWLLTALSYSGQNHTSVSDGEAYLDGSDRLVVGNDGAVTYRAAQPGKYPVPAAGESATVAEAIEAARAIVEGTVGAQCGEAGLYLISTQETDGGWLVRFGYRLDGAAVWLYDDGWAAEFLVKDGYITEFTLRFRTYAATAERQPLLPMDKAAAMLPSLTDELRELVLQYRDRGGATVSPAWVAE